ncbi:hypothetical protein CISIN_1g034579mg [Citrus sinensis]|uniref:Uncharacterized protein n=1 Tax=Citrus sinensis TaxID=2711 RepID=A0A067DS09_CITSI|nr:hypothetical protein CISIN_1g034579mg [Citrus sinensis]
MFPDKHECQISTDQLFVKIIFDHKFELFLLVSAIYTCVTPLRESLPSPFLFFCLVLEKALLLRVITISGKFVFFFKCNSLFVFFFKCNSL